MTELAADLVSMMNQITKLRRPFTPKGLPYACLEDFLLREGDPMQPPPADPKIRLGPMKQCFMNASRLAIGNRRYQYVEGMVLFARLPLAIHHAWVIDPEGYAIDPTIAWCDAAYYGVVFSTPDLNRRLLAQEYYGLFDSGVGYTDILCGTDPTFNYRNRSTDHETSTSPHDAVTDWMRDCDLAAGR